MEKNHSFGDVHDSSVNWSSLPHDILSSISNKVTDLKDYIRFRAVSGAWRTMYTDNGNHVLRERLLLMLPTACPKNPSLYSLYESKIYSNLTRSLPENMYCRGSSYGWLAMVSNDTHNEVCLVNPFLSVNSHIQLPPLTEFDPLSDVPYKGIFMRKVVLSADPILYPKNYVVMASHGQFGRASFFKPGDKAWTPLNLTGIYDIIYNENKFFFLHSRGMVCVCDVHGPCPTDVSEVAPKVEMRHFGQMKYLVKSCDDLLQVTRHRYFYVDKERQEQDQNEEDDEELDPSKWPNYYYTNGFTVLKLDTEGEWMEKESLDGQVIFVGDNSSLSLSVSNMPGCKPNCIYFTDDFHEGYFNLDDVEPHDIGIFNMEDKSIIHGHPIEGRAFVSPPVLIQPTLNYY